LVSDVSALILVLPVAWPCSDMSNLDVDRGVSWMKVRLLGSILDSVSSKSLMRYL